MTDKLKQQKTVNQNDLTESVLNDADGNQKKLCKLDVRNCEPSSSSLSMVQNGTNKDLTVACPEMCYFCFDVLRARLFSKNKGQTTSASFTNDPYPLFVTWKIGESKKLRGCVGTFNPQPLHNSLRDYAISSALRDSRFSPISADEFARLHVSVSILVQFEECANYADWVVGVHGVWIEFRNEAGYTRTATFLPEVAKDENWTQLQTIDALLRKGGIRGKITEEIRSNIVRTTRYRSEKISVSYNEYEKQNGAGGGQQHRGKNGIF